MTWQEKYLKPHAFFVHKTFNEHCDNIPEFYFKAEVPEDVVRNFEVIKTLLAFSYYEYKLIDEAYSKALHTFEMAMKIRLSDFDASARNKSFKPLLATLNKHHLFETDYKQIQYLESLRNHYAHPKSHSFAGAVVWNKIQGISMLINEMYEDVSLRLKRKEQMNNFRKKMKDSSLNNGVVIEINSEHKILYDLRLLFINNKKEPNSYLFACTPLWDFGQNEHQSSILPFVFKSKLVKVNLENAQITGISFEAKQAVKFYSAESSTHLIEEYQKWKSKFDQIDFTFPIESGISMNFFNHLNEEKLLFQRNY
ncbi:MAG: hypothetical protein GC181_05205 [Bacteroidetes bacterium]|nr:hypothetical protein [Bacteroidota bacterium]